VASSGSSCGAGSGTGNVTTTVDLLPAGTATFTVQGTVSQLASGSLSNTATVSAPAGVTDPNLGNNSATDTDSLTPTADLSITKTDGATTVTAGAPDTYTITVQNAGPSAVTGATVADSLPAALTGATWTCAASAGSACGASSGTGSLNTTVDLLSGGTATYTVSATVSPAASGTLSNTATVSPPGGVTDPDLSNNSATDTDTVAQTADLAITKSDSQATAVPGTAVTYTIVVSNNGPSPVSGATITDTLPAGLLSATWTCAASPGSSCGAPSGSGDIITTADLLVGGAVTYTLTATIDPGATGSLSNTAVVAPPSGVVDPSPGNNAATDIDTLAPSADLSIIKAHSGDFTAGLAGTYTMTVSNGGPSAAAAPTVTDTLPAGLTFSSGGNSAWSCAGAAQVVTCTSASAIAEGASSSFPLTVSVSPSAAPGVTNTASVTSATPDPVPANNSASDMTRVLVVDLALLKTLKGQLVPGNPATYTLAVSNMGTAPTFAPVVVTDTLPSALTFVSGGGGGWTCSATGQVVTCTDAASIAAGASSSFVITVRVATGAAGGVVNQAVVRTTADTNAANDAGTASASITVTPPVTTGSPTAAGPLTPGTPATPQLPRSGHAPAGRFGLPLSFATVVLLACLGASLATLRPGRRSRGGRFRIP